MAANEAQKNVFIEIEFENGQKFQVHAMYVARVRADYYARLDVERGDASNYDEARQVEYDFAMGDDMELLDWLQNNMDWNDIQHNASLVMPVAKTDYENMFPAAQFRVRRDV